MRKSLGILALLAALAADAAAQSPAVTIGASPADDQSAAVSDGRAPVYVAFVDGAAVLERNAANEPAEAGTVLIDGDRIRTGDARVEFRHPLNVVVFADQNTTIDLASDDVWRLGAGRVRVRFEPAASGSLRLETPAGSVHVRAPGDYRVSVVDRRDGLVTELIVIEGSGDLANELGAMPAATGERVATRAFAAPGFPQQSGFKNNEQFDLWVAGRLDATTPTTTAEYLPADLTPYSATLDAYGTWESAPDYGYVWYPQVAIGWQPYVDGRWRRAGRYGWTWHGSSQWAWPTHHYGRWGWDPRGRWFWVPQAGWGPAWVSWAVGPGFVAWCPLGWSGRPVFASGAHRSGWGVPSRDWPGARTRVPLDRRRPTSADAAGFDSWAGWSVVPSDRLLRGEPVWKSRVDGRSLSDVDRGAFVTQRVPPSLGGTATGRIVGAGPSGRGPSGRTYSTRPGRVGPTRVDPGPGPGAMVAPVPMAPEPATSPYDRAERVMRARPRSAPEGPSQHPPESGAPGLSTPPSGGARTGRPAPGTIAAPGGTPPSTAGTAPPPGAIRRAHGAERPTAGTAPPPATPPPSPPPAPSSAAPESRAPATGGVAVPRQSGPAREGPPPRRPPKN